MAMKIEEILKVAFINASVAKGLGELWQKITDRLKGKSDAKKILDRIDQNSSNKDLKKLLPFLEEEMNKNPQFAEEITRLAQESNNTSAGDAIEMKNYDNSSGIGKAQAQTQFFGGIHHHEKKT